MASPKIGPSFFGKENYEKYISELTTEGTIGGEKLTPGERVEGFKKRNDKISFESFVDKVLARKKPEEKEKIREGNINRVNVEYDNKVPTGGEIKKYGAITRISDAFSNNPKILSSVESVSKLMSLETIKPVIEEQTISLFKDDNGTFRSEVDPVIKEVSSDDLEGLDELLETIRDEPEGLDDLLKEVRESDSVQPITDDQKEVLDNLTKANKSLLSTNELIEGFIKSVEKENLKEEKRRFKEKDAARKRVRKESFERSRSISPIGGLSKSIAKPSGFLEGLLKFGFLSALAGLVPLIPKLIEFVETLPERIEKFFTKDIPEFIGKRFEDFKKFVGGFFKDRFNEVKQFFEDIYTSIDDFTGGKFTEFIDGIKGLGPMIVEKSQEFYKTIDDWTGGRITGAFDWIGKNVIDPVGAFFKEKIDYVGTKAGELWTNFSSSFLNFFGDIEFELPEFPDLGVTEAISNTLGLEPAIEGPDLTQDLVAVGGSTAANIAPVSGAKGMAVEGMDASQVASQIPNMNVGGKSVQLGTGLSQGGTTEDVQKQISGLREGGAKGVQVLGTGDTEKDAALQELVSQNKDFATFLPVAKTDTGGIDYQATAAIGKQQIQDNAAMREQQRTQSVSGTGPYAGILGLLEKYEAGAAGWESMYPNTSLPGATNMTIAEVADKATGAVGMYQNLPKYLNERAVAVNLDPTKDKYTPENQIKIAEYLIGKGQANVTPQMLKDNPDESMLRLSKVWAAIPVPYDTQGANRRVSKGESYYAGDGVNKAHITPDMMYSAMKYRPTKPPKQRPTQTKPFSTSLTTGLDEYDAQQRLGTRQLPQTVSTEKVVPNRDQIVVTSRMGPRWGKMHYGSDIASPVGSPLHAFTDGVITATGYDGGYGNYIAWKDIFGMEHFYAHLDKTIAKRGDSVKAGTVIAKSGNTGKGTGPHLHWEYGPENQTGRNSPNLVDPLDKFDYMMPFGSKKILSKPDDSPQPIPSRPVSFAPELGKLKQSADSISTPSGRRSAGGNVTTINMPPTQTKTPTVTTSRDGGGNDGQYTSRPIVSAINFDDMYQTHTRSLFNILR